VIKYNANQRYATTAITASIVRQIASKLHVPLQVTHQPADLYTYLYLYDTIRDAVFLHLKADMSRLNLPHGTNTKKQKREKLKSKKMDVLRSINKQSGESVESVLKKKWKGCGGKGLQKRKVLSLE